ncbi:MAG TPA: NAD(P)/FAD-dependent oxidoreductase [Verrucomicrobiae bacterium]|nr:NAD(P)/FAD-dependent oxidoreductase [Verrucomicrobiae bacterium]
MMHYDAIIIGGGPGGSSAATYLSRAGKRVLALEKEIFPRFHIGESLLPYNHRIFRELGLLPALKQAGFIPKYGAQFILGSGTKATKFVFRDGRYTREPEAVQVDRATFDHILMKHARASGAEIREGWTVSKFSNEPGGVVIEARSGSNPVEQFRAKFLIDASGRGNVTGNQEGLRIIHPRLKKLAVFGHFRGVKMDEGDRFGDTIVIRLENKWFWVIPITRERTSVGCVMNQEEFANAKLPPAEIFERIWRTSEALCERMKNAKLDGPMHTTSDFSYYNRRLVGERLLRVGDAAGFMDPIFSSGVYLAMFSGKLAAEAVAQSLDANDDGRARLKKYERRVRAAMKFYWELVEKFYTKPFMEIFLEPREKFNIVPTVNAVLAGELEGGWALRWRLRLFYWIVKAQGYFPLVPRVKFD